MFATHRMTGGPSLYPILFLTCGFAWCYSRVSFGILYNPTPKTKMLQIYNWNCIARIISWWEFCGIIIQLFSISPYPIRYSSSNLSTKKNRNSLQVTIIISKNMVLWYHRVLWYMIFIHQHRYRSTTWYQVLQTYINTLYSISLIYLFQGLGYQTSQDHLFFGVGHADGVEKNIEGGITPW